MKAFITTLLFIVVLIFSSYGQKEEVKLPMDPASGKIMFTEVVNVDSTSKGELFNRASSWFATKYNSSKEVIQRSDKVEGVIIGKAIYFEYMKGLMSENIGSGSEVRYTISVHTKDGKYKYEITDFMFHDSIKTVELGSASSPKHGYTKKYWVKAKQHCLDEGNSLILSLKETMEKRTDW